MSTTSNSTSSSRPTSRHHDTGFPDSFAACTTSMRHPDAIVDPGFAISAEHIDPVKTLHRSRKSLLHKHRRTISQGKLTEGVLGRQDESATRSSLMLSTSDSAADITEQKHNDASVAAILQTSKADAERPHGKEGSENLLRVSPGFHYTTDEERRRSKIFRILTNKH